MKFCDSIALSLHEERILVGCVEDQDPGKIMSITTDKQRMARDYHPPFGPEPILLTYLHTVQLSTIDTITQVTIFYEVVMKRLI